MAANQPIPINIYSRTETDLKLENVEQPLDAKMEKLSSDTRAGFELLHQDRQWMKNVLLFVIIPFLVLALTGLLGLYGLIISMMNTFKHVG